MYLKEGTRLHNDKYRLLNILGEGGFSLTYRGAWKTEVQGTLGKIPTLVPVCIKEYFFKDYCFRNETTNFVGTNNETGKEIFEKNKEKIVKEARILAELHHPNVVSVLEVFKQHNTVYIVMEFISGSSLKQLVEQNGALSENKLKTIIYKIGQALEYIHSKNILHLDIKPSNILIDKNNNPRLIDFGISKKYDLADDQQTSTTLQAASKGYASIEQYDSEGTQVFSPRPDIYSLGATMYYLLTGQVPTESILRSTKGLTNPRELNPEISENTEKVILKAMALNPKDRYETVMDMLVELGYDPVKDKIDLDVISGTLEEKTELIKKLNATPYDADLDDQTQIYSDEEKDPPKKKRILLFSILGSVIIVLLATLFFFKANNEKTPEITESEKIQAQNKAFYEHYFAGINHFNQNNLSRSKEEFLKAIDIKESDAAQTYIKKIDSIHELLINKNQISQLQLNNTPAETTPSSDNTESNRELTEEEKLDERYSNLYTKGLQLYQQEKYEEALKSFREALNVRQTKEARDYINLSQKELNRIAIDNKLNLYEKFPEFGNFVVARRKADGKFGAIDKEGNEIIPFEYLSSDRIGENRMFLRTDDLYDIYSPSGKLLKEATNEF